MMDENQMRHTVLMVEDDPFEVGLARSAAAGFSHEFALTLLQDADAVLGWLSEGVANSQQMPCVILIDLKLPKLDGLAVLRRLRMHTVTHDIPIVAFSAEYTQADVLMSYQAGANSFVAKPADFAQFTEFFREQLAYWMHPHQREMFGAAKVDAAG